MKETLTLQFDGGSRGNPGPAGIGVVVPHEEARRWSRSAASSAARPTTSPSTAPDHGDAGGPEARRKKVIIRGDSELIVSQMLGEYRVKHADMKELYDEAQELIEQFDDAKIEHNLRHKNELADKLANLAMDRKQDVTDVNEGPSAAAEPAGKPASAFLKVGEKFSCSNCGCEVRLDVLPPDGFTRLQPFKCLCGTQMSRQK